MRVEVLPMRPLALPSEACSPQRHRPDPARLLHPLRSAHASLISHPRPRGHAASPSAAPRLPRRPLHRRPRLPGPRRPDSLGCRANPSLRIERRPPALNIVARDHAAPPLALLMDFGLPDRPEHVNLQDPFRRVRLQMFECVAARHVEHVCPDTTASSGPGQGHKEIFDELLQAWPGQPTRLGNDPRE